MLLKTPKPEGLSCSTITACLCVPVLMLFTTAVTRRHVLTSTMERGQLGLGRASPSSSLPCSVAFKLAPQQRIVEIFCGYEHTFALTSDGDVMGFGNGVKGQLGIGNTDSHSSPQRVHLLCGKGVVKMAAGLEHSLALTDSGDLYSFGDNLSGQLGLGHNYTAKEQTPQKVPSLSKAMVTQMACGQDHTAVLTSSGEMFCFGNNRFGALGLAGHANEGPPIVASSPQLVTDLKGKDVVQIGCGLQHTVALTSAGSVYCWGNNGRGQLGTGDTHNRYNPSLVCKPLSAAKCIHVACGGQHTLAVTDHDDVYGFGSDRHGQLGLGQGAVILPVPSRIVRLGGRRVEHAVGGAWHTVVRTDTGENYLMGCILPSANVPQAGGGAEAAGPGAEGTDVNRRSARLSAKTATSPTDPFALSFGGFRRLLLPRGAEACSKGHSLFYGQGLGAPPTALRKVVKSLERLKGDVSRMLLRQDPDVIFTRNNSTCTTAETFDGQIDPLTSATTRAEAADGSDTVGAHLAILRARCPSLYQHAATAISRGSTEPPETRAKNAKGRAVAWRVCSPAGIPMDALRLVVSYLYQDAGVFDKRKPDSDEHEAAFIGRARSPSPSSEKGPSQSAKPVTTTPSRAQERRERLWSIRSKAGVSDTCDEEVTHGTAEATMDPWDEWEVGEEEAAAGFGSFGSAYGSQGKYDGAGLDRLMRVMAAARTLKLNRLQGLCEKRAEAFIESRTVHKVLRRAAEGNFPYLKRRCLEFCLMHLGEVCAPENSAEVVLELSKHGQVLADLLSLSAASDSARLATARDVAFDGAGRVPCIEALRGAGACVVPVEGYQRQFRGLFENVVRKSVPSEHLSPRAVEVAGRTKPVEGSLPSSRPPSNPATTFDIRESRSGDEEREDLGVLHQAEDSTVRVHPFEAQGDFKIRAGEGMPAVTVHRCILAARSGFFRALLEGGIGNAAQDELTLKFEPTVSIDALLEFICFLYTGRTGAMGPLTALDVLFLTKGEQGSGGFFQVVGNDELRAFCTATLVKGMECENGMSILVRSKGLGDEETLETAISFLLANFDQCLRPQNGKDDGAVRERVGVPACMRDDESPAVDLLLALAERCTVQVKDAK